MLQQQNLLLVSMSDKITEQNFLEDMLKYIEDREVIGDSQHWFRQGQTMPE